MIDVRRVWLLTAAIYVDMLWIPSFSTLALDFLLPLSDLVDSPCGGVDLLDGLDRGIVDSCGSGGLSDGLVFLIDQSDDLLTHFVRHCDILFPHICVVWKVARSTCTSL